MLDKAHQRRPGLLSCRGVIGHGLRAQARLEVRDQGRIQLQRAVLVVVLPNRFASSFSTAACSGVKRKDCAK